MAKNYVNQNVYELAKERIAFAFKEFENVLVAFSGGKDSSVCLEMCYDYAKETNQLHKLAMYHLDYEAQYQMTTDFVEETFKRFSDIKRYWLCLPVGANCGCKMDSGTWTTWESSKKDIRVREMPKYDYVITEDNCPFKMEVGEQDYSVQTKFCKWFSKKYGKTSVVIGIRADESLNRYVAVSKDDKKIIYKDKKWCSKVNNITINAYPIYDWNVQDIWVYNAKFRKPYNEIYDLYYQAGLKIEQMRVANPFHSCGTENLKLYKVIDPNNWGKMVGRINGVNFTAIYGGTTAMGWKSIKLPKGHTWKSYLDFLLNTLDEKTRNHYIKIFNTSMDYWLVKGGNIDKKLYEELLQKNKCKIKEVKQAVRYEDKYNITFSEYMDDVDISKFAEIPTYKRMCICIMKNDYFCKYMGFGQTKEQLKRRKRAIEKYAKL